MCLYMPNHMIFNHSLWSIHEILFDMKLEILYLELSHKIKKKTHQVSLKQKRKCVKDKTQVYL